VIAKSSMKMGSVSPLIFAELFEFPISGCALAW